MAGFQVGKTWAIVSSITASRGSSSMVAFHSRWLSSTAAPAAGTAAGSSTSILKCFACGQVGHTAKKCPNVPEEDRQKYMKGLDGGCFVCGEQGHQAANCPKRGVIARTCFRCGQSGHMISECPSLTAAEKQKLQQGRCMLCGGSGHTAQRCPFPEGVKCLSCGQVGHMMKDCPNVPEAERKKASDFFKEGRCLLCGELGHAAKDCPTIGGNPALGKPVQPQQPKPSPQERHAHKVCFQCGEEGHIMNECPIAPNTMRIKGIRDRYRGSRLNKMLPLMLQEERKLAPAHEVLSSAKPLTGVVVATNTEKTCAVLVPRFVIHPLLKIPLDRSIKFLVHDESEKAVCGDVVSIVQCRPISKRKHHALKEVVISLNERRTARAEKMTEVRKQYAELNDKALAEMEEAMKRYEERKKAREEKWAGAKAEEGAKLNEEIERRKREMDIDIADAVSDFKSRNHQWMEGLEQTHAKADAVAEEMLRNTVQLAKDLKLDVSDEAVNSIADPHDVAKELSSPQSKQTWETMTSLFLFVFGERVQEWQPILDESFTAYGTRSESSDQNKSELARARLARVVRTAIEDPKPSSLSITAVEKRVDELKKTTISSAVKESGLVTEKLDEILATFKRLENAIEKSSDDVVTLQREVGEKMLECVDAFGAVIDAERPKPTSSSESGRKGKRKTISMTKPSSDK